MSRGSKRRRGAMARDRAKIQGAAAGEFLAGVSPEALAIEDDVVARSQRDALHRALAGDHEDCGCGGCRPWTS